MDMDIFKREYALVGGISQGKTGASQILAMYFLRIVTLQAIASQKYI
jgi:hypothetical protein